MTASPAVPTAPAHRRPAARFPRPEDRDPHDPSGASALPGDPDGAPRVLWAGDDDVLHALVADHVAANGCALERIEHGEANPAPADLVIGTVPGLARQLGSSPRVGHGGQNGRGRAMLLAVAGDTTVREDDWHLCLQLGVRGLVRLPAESERLLDLLGEALRPRGGALVVGLTGGCGGAGASSTAARLAGAWARRGAPTVLVDADPLGGGLDLLVEAPASRGSAWEDVGRLDAQDGAQLRSGLPVIDGVHLLAAREGRGPSPEQASAVLAALAPLDGVVIADLASGHVPATLPHLDRLILVVPATDHAVRAASRRLARWEGARGRCEVVVRRSGPLDPAEVGADLALPLAGDFRDTAGTAVPLLDVQRRGADRMCSRLAATWEVPAWTS